MSPVQVLECPRRVVTLSDSVSSSPPREGEDQLKDRRRGVVDPPHDSASSDLLTKRRHLSLEQRAQRDLDDAAW